MNWLITGVGSGLGRALAKAALARGDAVAGTVRATGDLAVFEALAPGRARGFRLDLADEAAIAAVAREAQDALGGVDVLVNNAGYGLVGAIEEASPDEIRAQFEVNVFGPLALIRAVLPAMRARRAGHIVNVTSVSGVATWAGTGVYCASKFALEGAALTLADEVAEFGIKVTNVEPGGMRTDYSGRSLRQTARVIDDYASVAHAARRILADHAGHEPGDPARVAAAIMRVVDAENPPRQLLLGDDAILYATRHMARFQEEMGAWAALSLSTGFEEP
ncbi:MAG: short-chain dehydrogenase/reductase [Caulobacteraceae bacterium]|nr:short-chain dehydrogenase/reductase [Caulobacteraceae bacterium]